MLICSNRPGALGPSIGQWLVDTITPRAAELGAEIVAVPLDLPFLDEEEHPSTGIYRHEHTRRWSETVAGADGFITVTPEYNHGMPATLKNALDHLSREWAWKPMGFVSYGHTSAGTRAVQHAKQVVTTLRLVPLGATAAIRIGDETRPDGAALGMLDELVRLSHALRPMRERAGAAPAPVPGSYARRLTPDDAPQVTVLQRCCWVEEAIRNDTLEHPALHESIEDVRGWLADHEVTGVWRDGRLLGMVRAHADGADWHIGRLGVLPDVRGHGLGRWLLRTAEAAASPDIRRLVLFTGAASDANIGLYRSCGYEIANRTDGVVRLVKPTPAGLAATV
ncbi:bifunctional NAD(P)H-dependent oxidoreductase/GNAT family N-acetyltransferase [Actinoplanes utahensis]|nr:FMN reductase [Actinoplanes utahensis]